MRMTAANQEEEDKRMGAEPSSQSIIKKESGTVQTINRKQTCQSFCSTQEQKERIFRV
jgi:hypothetical protein